VLSFEIVPHCVERMFTPPTIYWKAPTTQPSYNTRVINVFGIAMVSAGGVILLCAIIKYAMIFGTIGVNLQVIRILTTRTLALLVVCTIGNFLVSNHH